MNLLVEQSDKIRYFICGTQLLLLQEHRAIGNPRLKWEYNIKMDVKV